MASGLEIERTGKSKIDFPPWPSNLPMREQLENPASGHQDVMAKDYDQPKSCSEVTLALNTNSIVPGQCDTNDMCLKVHVTSFTSKRWRTKHSKLSLIEHVKCLLDILAPQRAGTCGIVTHSNSIGQVLR